MTYRRTPKRYHPDSPTRILAALSDGRAYTREELAEMTGVPVKTVAPALIKLRLRGKVKTVDVRKDGKMSTWALA